MSRSDLRRIADDDARRRRLDATGLRFRATVVSVRDAGATLGTTPLRHIEVELCDPDATRPASRRVLTEAVPTARHALARPGATVTVVADGSDAMIDWWDR